MAPLSYKHTLPILSQRLSCVPVRNVYKPQELPGVVVYSSNPSTWNVKAGGSGVQGQSQLCHEFEAKLSYTVRKIHQDLRNLHVIPCFLAWTRESWEVRTYSRG